MHMSVGSLNSGFLKHNTACEPLRLAPRKKSCTRVNSIQSKRESDQTADSVTSAGRSLNVEKEMVERGAEEASSSQQNKAEQDRSGKEIGQQLASIRGNEGSSTGLFQGVLEETQLIAWPAPFQAVKDTVTVVATVGLAAIFLFGLNTGLTEASKLLYKFKLL